MNKRTVFEFGSYKTYLGHRLSPTRNRGQMTRAAEALKCQRSYLSRVISEKLHLTPDHAFKLAGFLGLPSNEREYFQTLVDFERAGDLEYRDHLKARLREMKRQHESVQERAERAHLSIDALQAGYFSSWISSAVHFLTSIPEYQSVESLSSRLNLKPGIVRGVLERLQAQGFVRSTGTRWIYESGEFHAPKDSPLVVLHHQNWRSRALMDAQDVQSDGVHFTAVQTISREDFQRLREMILEFISDLSRVCGPSKPEEGVGVTLDLFRI